MAALTKGQAFGLFSSRNKCSPPYAARLAPPHSRIATLVHHKPSYLNLQHCSPRSPSTSCASTAAAVAVPEPPEHIRQGLNVPLLCRNLVLGLAAAAVWSVAASAFSGTGGLFASLSLVAEPSSSGRCGSQPSVSDHCKK